MTDTDIKNKVSKTGNIISALGAIVALIAIILLLFVNNSNRKKIGTLEKENDALKIELKHYVE
ncbi:MAG: hypothetical protein PHR20_07560 [Bacteroidales bacterium]|nr:hypothetical protein [Bacteroidales bacterium]